MVDDHLSNEVSVSAEVTPTGVQAKAKSRTISALDRLVGSTFDRLSAPLEGTAAEIRAKSEVRAQLIKAAGTQVIANLGRDPEFVARALEGHVEAIARRLENKEAVAAAALEDLRHQPPTAEEAAAGGEKLDDMFLNRFERYAEDATEKDLREKWGRVLASEIRKPGTFSPKFMRIIDEIDRDTARIFEEICQYRLGINIIKCLCGDLEFNASSRLIMAGLLFDPGEAGQVQLFDEITDNSGVDLWFASFGVFGVAFPRSATIDWKKNVKPPPVAKHKESPSIPIYILTDAGNALSVIVNNQLSENFNAYCNRLATFLAPTEVRIYHHSMNGQFVMTGTLSKPLSEADRKPPV